MRHGRGWWKKRFRGRGLRITEPREAILKVLNNAKKHLSAKEIFYRLQNILPDTGIATVYRNLEVLESLKLIARFDFGDGVVRYSLQRDEEDISSHLICEVCGKILEFPEGKEVLRNNGIIDEDGISDKYDFDVDIYRLNIYGRCSDCVSDYSD